MSYPQIARALGMRVHSPACAAEHRADENAGRHLARLLRAMPAPPIPIPVVLPEPPPGSPRGKYWDVDQVLARIRRRCEGAM